MYNLLLHQFTRHSRLFKKGHTILLSFAQTYLAILIACSNLSAQKKSYVRFFQNDKQQYTETYQVDTVQWKAFVNLRLAEWRAAGFVAAAIDSVSIHHDTCSVFVFKGKEYVIRQISLTEEQTQWLESYGIRTSKFSEGPMDSLYVSLLLQSTLQSMTRNGYPFASVSLANVLYDDQGFQASLTTEKGPYITLDTLITEGSLVVKPWFLRRLLSFRNGLPYTHELAFQADKKLRNLPYSTQTQGPVIRFHGEQADLLLSLDKKPFNRFDFLVGIQPQPIGSPSSVILTGDFLSETHNLLEMGEFTHLQIKRIKAGSLEMILKSTIPYLGDNPLGSHLDFRMFKNQSLHLDVSLDAGGQFDVNASSRMQVFASFKASSLIQVDVSAIQKTGRLPARLDSRYRGLGLSFSSANLDYRWNPRKGWQLESGVNLGTRSIQANRQITSLEGFSSSYDSLDTPSFQSEIFTMAAFYLPLTQKWILASKLQGALKYNARGLLANELKRVGGNRTLRGFDEESIFTDKYLIASTELRLILDQNSFLSFPVIDAGFINLPLSNVSGAAWVASAGLGLSFSTPAGVFNLTIAAGIQQNIPFSFSNTKIHFGYISLF